MNQGDLLLVKYPYSNLVNYKIRPALVVSNNPFNATHDIWICPITTKQKAQNISVDDGIIEGALDKQSYANTTKVSTTNEEAILKKIGALSKEKTAEIIEAIKRNF